ncbi:hypothetical protein [Microbacterium sp. MPKO10]|uniref:hypothetical protein n=1 Tax=Microbacterium sp. MPKO10 TaxID=2989818 RepID=UPI0022357688|nr:hypothetical protein [Microbacterium sp. MPKO10]MCW4460053.1 hypothetical protein [Microbacterium sp. MPKO10]
MDFEQYARDYRRKQHRRGILLIITGAIFTLVGALICMIGSPWFGAAILFFGASVIVGGLMTLQKFSTQTNFTLGLVGCVLFVAMSALMLVSGLVDPDAWGWRGGVAGVIVGVLGLCFSVPAAIVLMVRKSRQRNGDSR